MSRKFQKKKEDFVCANCGCRNDGDGYTNHCRQCLFSRHVDVYPGDRNESCGGLMKPTSLVAKNDVYTVVHKCLTCGATKNNIMQKGDNFDVAVHI